ncbi:MAG: 50S ribosomal protein L23 [Nitrospirota bacterium]
MDEHQVIRRPLLTEKSTILRDGQHKVAFAVHPSATKPAVKAAVERILKVKVLDVNMMNVRGKRKRVGRFEGRRSDWKKAIVTLKPGEKLELFEGA